MFTPQWREPEVDRRVTISGAASAAIARAGQLCDRWRNRNKLQRGGARRWCDVGDACGSDLCGDLFENLGGLGCGCFGQCEHLFCLLGLRHGVQNIIRHCDEKCFFLGGQFTHRAGFRDRAFGDVDSDANGFGRQARNIALCACHHFGPAGRLAAIGGAFGFDDGHVAWCAFEPEVHQFGDPRVARGGRAASEHGCDDPFTPRSAEATRLNPAAEVYPVLIPSAPA